MRILLTGASGLIGTALASALAGNAHEVVRLERRPGVAKAGQATWEPAEGRIDLSQLAPLEAVVHLAGETVGQRWTSEARKRIRDSRVRGTGLLCAALACLNCPPRTLICASAIGFYGDQGNAWLDEQSPAGTGFLAEVTQDWERASAAAEECGLRVAHLRIGLVLSRRGGALARMLPAFRLGLGGPLGGGGHYWSWITLEDSVRAIQHVLDREDLGGPLNVVAPGVVTNREFTRTLGRVLGRPAAIPVPRWLVLGLFGGMGREALLGSARVRAARLQSAGFEFRHPELEPALRFVLREPEGAPGRRKTNVE